MYLPSEKESGKEEPHPVVLLSDKSVGGSRKICISRFSGWEAKNSGRSSPQANTRRTSAGIPGELLRLPYAFFIRIGTFDLWSYRWILANSLARCAVETSFLRARLSSAASDDPFETLMADCRAEHGGGCGWKGCVFPPEARSRHSQWANAGLIIADQSA